MDATDEPLAIDRAVHQERPEPRFPAVVVRCRVCGEWTLVGASCGACGNRLYLPNRLLESAGV